MTSRNPRPAFTDNQSFKPQDVPLLGGSANHDGSDGWDDDLERVDGEFAAGYSPRSSFELTNPRSEHVSSSRRTPSWKAKAQKSISLLTRSIPAWKSDLRPSAGSRSRYLCGSLYFIAMALMMLGILQFVSFFFLAVAAIFPNASAYFVDHWGDPGTISEGLLHWPTDFSRDIQPVPCHSHNDYWRKVPLYSALQAGCVGVEADVWLVDDELYVGHSTSSLTPNRTLKSLYINPLLDVLAKQNPTTKFHPNPDSSPNGVFDTDHAQTLILLVDFKTDGASLWPHVYAQLDPLRQKGFLTHFDGTSVNEGPITVVATGNAPFDLLTSNSTSRDIFFDAPLDRMATDGTPSNQNAGQGTSGNAPTGPSAYNITNSYYASTSFEAAIGTIWSNPSTTQLERMRAQIQGAHQQGLKARYWETPSWPRGLRDHIWNVLLEEGVDFLNVDDLKAATRGTWGNWS